jgi:hypothetical protein
VKTCDGTQYGKEEEEVYKNIRKEQEYCSPKNEASMLRA